VPAYRINYTVVFEVDAETPQSARAAAFSAVSKCLDDTCSDMAVISIELGSTESLAEIFAEAAE